tara:strand:- start:186 stop:392 length:207 start_codon:yes stop_codon:yes gene_type:complete
MLTLFSKRHKGGESNPVSDEEIVLAERKIEASRALDDDTLKKNIADKLRNYRPIEREANFTGPKFYNN